MSSKIYKKERDGLQQGIYRIINPFVRLLIRMGVTPNMVTTIGLLGNIAAAAIIAYAGYDAVTTGSPRFDLMTWAGAVTIIFSLFDMLDGQVARLGNMVSRFGALYDSVLDRYCELFTVGAIAYYLIMNGYVIGALIAFLALVGSLVVGYGPTCGIVGMACPSSPDTALTILVIAMAIIAVFANITAFARVDVCRKGLK